MGPSPTSIVAGDFNGDGRLDLAVTDYGELPNNVWILLGNGDGTFRAAQTYSAGEFAEDIVEGDFTGNGKLDLAVADLFPGAISILLGNGDGTFQPARTVGDLDTILPEKIVAGDFNGDGKLDLAVTGRDGGLEILLGNGDGTFEPAEPVSIPTGITNSIVAADFTGDGRLDLALSYVSGTVAILLGNGDGTFQPGIVIPDAGSGWLIAGDFTGNGKLDLALANGSKVSILFGNGDGTFQPGVLYAIGSTVLGIAAGDFTGDGKLDLAVSTNAGTTLLLGDGNGSFSPAGLVDLNPQSNPLVADVNGDGTDDTLVVDGSGDVLYRQGVPGQPGTFEPPVVVNPGFPSRDIAWVPNTIDGPVLASADAQDNAVSLFAFRDGGFVRIGSLATGGLPAQIIAADLNGDGWDDLIVRNAGDGTLSVYYNASDTTLLRPHSSGRETPEPRFFGIPVTLAAGLGVSDVQVVDTTGRPHSTWWSPTS